MAKILVTGGLGFIGSNLVLELRSRGYEVWATYVGFQINVKYAEAFEVVKELTEI